MKQILLTLTLGGLVSLAQAQAPPPCSFSHTDSTTASWETFWTLWTDVPNWHRWDTGLRSATLKGPFAAGTQGELLPDKGSKARFEITEVKADTGYTFRTRIPLGWLEVQRRAQRKGSVIYFTHRVRFTGPLRRVFFALLGKRYRAMLPEVMRQLKTQAEQA